MKLKYLFLTLFISLVLVGSCLGSNKIIDLRLSGDLVDGKGVLTAGEIKRSSAATYINEGILYTVDGDDTPFSHSSIEDETGATSMRGSFVDGQAWFHDAGGLIAVYADTGDLLILDDGAGGDKAYGFMGEVGTGEALAAEALDDPGLTDAGEWDDTDANVTQNAGAGTVTWDGLGSGTFFTTDGAGQFTVKKLYKIVIVIDSIASGVCYVHTSASYAFKNWAAVQWATPGTKTIYFVCTADNNLGVYGSATCDAVVSNISVKEVTEPNANAVHIYKEHGLLNEGWNAIDTEIDYNVDATWDFDVYVNLLSSTGSTAEARFEDGQLLDEGEATNHCLYSRDLSNSVWVKTDCTGTKNQIGLDEVANSASLLTATGANGTAFQTLGMASSTKSYYVYIRRSVGAGTISITDNGGTNYTECTGLSSTAFTKYRITRTQATPVIGLKITTSGDAIIVDCNQLEQTAFSTTPVPTLSIPVTRTSEAGNVADNGIKWTMGAAVMNALAEGTIAGTLIFKWTPGYAHDEDSGNYSLISCQDSYQSLIYVAGASALATYDGTTAATVNLNWTSGTTYTVALRWSDADNALQIGVQPEGGSWTWGTEQALDATGFTIGADDELKLSYAKEFPSHIKEIKFYDTCYTTAEVEAGIYRRVLKWMMHFELP